MSVIHMPFWNSGRAWCGRRLTKQQRLLDDDLPRNVQVVHPCPRDVGRQARICAA